MFEIGKKVESKNYNLKLFLSQYHSIYNLIPYKPILLRLVRYIGIAMIFSDVA